MSWFDDELMELLDRSVAERAAEEARLPAQPRQSLQELQRQREQRNLKRKKLLDLREQVVRLSRLARIGRKVKEEDLYGMTENQLRSLVQDLKAVREAQLEAERSSYTPEQRVDEYKSLKRRQQQRGYFDEKRKKDLD